MLKLASRLQQGATIIELMVALAVLAIVITMGAPAYSQWIQNSQIRTAAESMLSGIQLARAEALKRNRTVRFQLMTSVDDGCAPLDTATNWVVSLDDATGKCANPDSSLSPFIVQFKSSTEGTRNATIASDEDTISFNGLGQLTPLTGTAITVDIRNPTGGSCTTGGSGGMRCLRIQVSPSGQVRMCDPAVTASDDPRKC